MKRILATTALTASLCMPAFAQDTDAKIAEETTAEAGTEMQANADFLTSAEETHVLASDFIGKRVYALESDADFGDAGVEEAGAEWDDIGEVSDVIMTRAGDIQAVIVDVGGFLGIGEKPVALSMDSLELVSDSNSNDDYFVTIAMTREALDQAPEFEFRDRDEIQQADAEGSVAQPLEETPGEEVDMAETEVEAAGEEAEQEVAEAEVEVEAAGEEAEQEMAEAEVEVEAAGEEAEQEMAEAGEELEAAGEEAEQEMAEAGEELEAAGEEAGQEMAEAGEEAEEALVVETESAEAEVEATDGEMAEAEVASTGNQLEPMAGFEREGYAEVNINEISSEELDGLAVYDPNDNRVGEISEVIITADGQVTDAVIDVGGFLGIGEKPVAISFDGISLQKQADGDDLRAYVNTTEEQLESFPEYEGG